MNKTIHRDADTTVRTFNDRSVEADYTTLLPLLRNGLEVLDVGCGTGAISNGIAERIGPEGHVVGIDNTVDFIENGKETFRATENLQLIHKDLFEFETDQRFDLIVSARVLQWLNNPKDALRKFISLLAPGGQVSVLDYDHTNMEWHPLPPESMLHFYETFLKWRADAGMNNQMAMDLPNYFSEVGLHSIEVFNADEVYTREGPNFLSKIGIWSRVAQSRQMVDEGYLSDELRLRAIEEYDRWIATDARSMVMKLNEVRGRI